MGKVPMNCCNKYYRWLSLLLLVAMMACGGQRLSPVVSGTEPMNAPQNTVDCSTPTPAEVTTESQSAVQPPPAAPAAVSGETPTDIPNLATREALLDQVNRGPKQPMTETITETVTVSSSSQAGPASNPPADKAVATPTPC